jgi:hypothetical protein
VNNLDLELEYDTPDIELEDDRTPALALDRRSYDSDNRLTITDCVISAAQVNPYIGREIPDFQTLGLDADKIYLLYRDRVALKAAVSKFNGIPLLIQHAAVSAADPKRQLQVGTVHDCRWSDDRVIGTVSVWDEAAIGGIESRVKRDLSAGYRYVPIMSPGVTLGGEKFAGRMTKIEPNHVALVIEGRVTGAMVGDAASLVPMLEGIPGLARYR